jgi:hypothetical protein
MIQDEELRIDLFAVCDSTQRAEFRANPYVGEPPCNGCPLAESCKRERMACRAFHVYVETNNAGHPDRFPSREIFDAIFDGVDRTRQESRKHQHRLWVLFLTARLRWMNTGKAA